MRALQALDPGRIAYCGTASKSFAQRLRIGWCVLPHARVEPALDALWAVGGPAASSIEQLTLADLVTSGAYDRHVRRVRSIYHGPRNELVELFRRRLPEVGVEGVSAGLTALLRLPAGPSEDDVWRGLARRSVSVFRLADFRVDPA